MLVRAEDIPKLKLVLPVASPAETLPPLPLLAARGYEIEIPQQARDEEAHFQIRHAAGGTGAGPQEERGERRGVAFRTETRRRGRRISIFGREEPLRSECPCVGEVGLVVVEGVESHAHLASRGDPHAVDQCATASVVVGQDLAPE